MVSKDDLKELDDQIVAQGQEMNQIREEMRGLKQDLKTLQSNFDGRFASSLAGGERLVGRDLGRDPGMSTHNMIDIAAKIHVTVFSNEIEQVFRMKRRNESNKQPGPVLVTLTKVVLHDAILQKKGDLSGVNGYEQVFMNADEPLEIRKAKSFLRKAAHHARKQGETVLFKHNQVNINDTRFTTDNFEEIPAKYLNPDCQQDVETNEQPMEASGGVDTTTEKERLIREGERMRLTKKGLLPMSQTWHTSQSRSTV